MSLSPSLAEKLQTSLAASPIRFATLWCGFLVLLVYCGMPAEELTFDNAFIIGDDTRLRIFSSESLRAIFTHDYWWPSMASNLFRPLTTLSFWLEYSFLGYGPKPLGYQIGNALLHWGNCVLLFVLGRRLGLASVSALAAATLFSIHPIATEVVANIVGRSDLFAAAAVLGGLICYLRATEARTDDARMARMFEMGLCGLFGVAAKESAIVLAALVAGHGLLRADEWWRGGESRVRWIGDAWRAILCLLPCACFFLLTRWLFSSTDGVTDHPFIDNPLMVEGFLVSRLSAFGVWGMQLTSLFLPLDLSNDYSFNAIPVAQWPAGNATAWWGWVTIAGFTGAFALAWRARLRGLLAASFLLMAYVVAMLPTSNLLVKIGSIRADRFHYMPTAFFWLLVVMVTGVLVSVMRVRMSEEATRKRVIGCAGALVAGWAVCVAALAHFRCYDWRSNLELWTSASVTQPNSAKVLSASGNVRVMVHQNEMNEKQAIVGHLKALDLFRSHQVPLHHWSLQTYSDLIACYLNLYDAMVIRGEKGPEAEAMLDSAFKVYAESRKVEEAGQKRWAALYGEAPRTTIRMVDVLVRNYALALSRRGRHEEAIKELEAVIELLPLKLQNRRTYADVLLDAGRHREALEELVLMRIMEPSEAGDVERIGGLAKQVSPSSQPLLRDEHGASRLNLQDALIKEVTRKGLVRYRRLLLKNELYLDAARVDRVARYFYGFQDWRTGI